MKGKNDDTDSARKLKEAYEENVRILNSMTDGFYSLDRNWIITDWNAASEKLLGKKRHEIIGKNLWELFPAAKEHEFYTEYTRALKTGKSSTFEEYYEPWGKWFDVSVYPTKEGLSVYFRDITEDRRLRLINKRTEEISGVAGWEYDVLTEEIFLTDQAYVIYGIPKDEPVSLDINKQLFDKDSLHKISDAITTAIHKHKPYEIELNLTKFDGNKRLLKINGFPLVENGKVGKLYGTMEDITRKKLEETRRQDTIDKLLTAQKIGKLGYWSADLVNDNIEWSREVCDIFGVDYESFTPNLENWMACVFPDDRDKFQKNLKTIFTNRKYFDFEHRIITPDGTVKWILERLNLQTDKKGNPVRLEGISQDITQQKSHEKEIHDSLREKEILLVEIHHRVKNNLAVISGLMQLQAYEEPSDAVRERLLECVGRIVSMSSIHEQLYNSKSFSNLDYSKNLKNLIENIVETMQIGKKIELSFDLEQVTLNVNQAIPTSLIINEVTTNVLKHAFTGRKKGRIHVIMAETDQTLTISVTDNGNRLPENFNEDERRTLGLRLIDILVQQLKGSYEFNCIKDGTSFVMTFRKTVITEESNS